ncbi:MAG: HTH domain-containing protein [Saprospiraceae bacterium]|nr:HTH domain-containing protein [Saprospiraceae bacterium]
MSDHLKTLYLVRCLGSGPMSSAELQEGLGVSRATLNRYLAAARHLGARIDAVQGRRVWVYSLSNWSECQRIVTRWIELEEGRTLIDPH